MWSVETNLVDMAKAYHLVNVATQLHAAMRKLVV
jgi:hypothetical protein